jgi:hypothetical protein
MSAFPDQPNHLLEWLRGRRVLGGDAGATPFCFIPRGTYGTYLADLVRELCASGIIHHFDIAASISLRVDGVMLTLESGEILATEFAVLATGNDAKPGLTGVPAVKPWSQSTLSKIEGDGSVLIIGTGSTMVDQVSRLSQCRTPLSPIRKCEKVWTHPVFGLELADFAVPAGDQRRGQHRASFGHQYSARSHRTRCACGSATRCTKRPLLIVGPSSSRCC